MRIHPLPALAAAVLLLVAVFSGCGGDEVPPAPPRPAGEEPSTPSRGDAVIRGSIGDASNLIPFLSSDTSSSDINNFVYNGLVRYDDELNIVGDLAESWEISPDGLEITFHLRDGVRWHDGEPFTAGDVLFTYETMIDPATPTAYAEDFRQVEQFEVLDDVTVRVRYGKPFAPALISWSMGIVPRHLLAGADLTTTELARRPVGTGPYRFVEWRTAEQIVLEANDDYWGGRPLVDRYVYRIIPDASTMFLDLKAGTVDWMNLEPIQYARQTDSAYFRENFSKHRYLNFQYTYLGFNLRRPLFQDRRVRRAVAHAIDKDELVAIVLHGLGQAVDGHYRPGTWACNPDVMSYPHDPEKARALLAEAGWADGDGDGFVDRDGERFTFTVLTNQGNQRRARTAEIIQGRLREVGIDMSIRTVEWAAFLENYVRPRDFDAVILGWRTTPDPDAYDIWHSSKTGKDELNHVSFANAEVDALLEEGRGTFDREERRQAYFRIQEILAAEQPYVFLYAPESLPVIHRRFRGVELGDLGITVSNVARWCVPPGEQKYQP